MVISGLETVMQEGNMISAYSLAYFRRKSVDINIKLTLTLKLELNEIICKFNEEVWKKIVV